MNVVHDQNKIKNPFGQSIAGFDWTKFACIVVYLLEKVWLEIPSKSINQSNLHQILNHENI